MTLTGWAEPVFAGEFSDEFVELDAWRRPPMRTLDAQRLEPDPALPVRRAGAEDRSRSEAPGIDVISLGIGDPDTPTPAHIVRGDGGGGRATPAPTSTRPTAAGPSSARRSRAFYARALRRRRSTRDRR